MGKRLDLTGYIFGQAQVESFKGVKNSHAVWNCVCLFCGEPFVVSAINLKSGNTQRCGDCKSIKTSIEDDKSIAEARADGEGVTALSLEYKVSRNTIYRAIKRHIQRGEMVCLKD